MFKRLTHFIRHYPSLVADPRVPAKAKYLPWIALAYLLIPVDLIPDFFILIGQLDDVGVILILMSMAMRAFEQSPGQKEKRKYGDVIDVTPIRKS